MEETEIESNFLEIFNPDKSEQLTAKDAIGRNMTIMKKTEHELSIVQKKLISQNEFCEYKFKSSVSHFTNIII